MYFAGLSRCVDEPFSFQGRNRRPPKDPFNSLLSLGYSILMNEVYMEIEARGLNPYFGFMHRDAEKHPTLVSDLMEEWRAVIVDAVVMSMINGHEISPDEFEADEEDGGCYLVKTSLGKFLSKLESKFLTESRYLSYVDYSVSFRRAISLQVGQLIKAIREEKADLYQPVLLR